MQIQISDCTNARWQPDDCSGVRVAVDLVSQIQGHAAGELSKGAVLSVVALLSLQLDIKLPGKDDVFRK